MSKQVNRKPSTKTTKATKAPKTRRPRNRKVKAVDDAKTKGKPVQAPAVMPEDLRAAFVDSLIQGEDKANSGDVMGRAAAQHVGRGEWAQAVVVDLGATFLSDGPRSILPDLEQVAGGPILNDVHRAGLADLEVRFTSRKSMSKVESKGHDGRGRFVVAIPESMEAIEQVCLIGAAYFEALGAMLPPVEDSKGKTVSIAKLAQGLTDLKTAGGKPAAGPNGQAWAAALIGKIGANPAGSTAPKARRNQGGKKTVTLQANDENGLSMLYRNLEPEVAAETRQRFEEGALMVNRSEFIELMGLYLHNADKPGEFFDKVATHGLKAEATPKAPKAKAKAKTAAALQREANLEGVAYFAAQVAARREG